MSVRIASFNTENLFARYRFREGQEAYAEDGFTINQLAFSVYNAESKRITGQAIKEVDADIVCLQEVENMAILEKFNSEYLAKLKYKNRVLIDSHDPRRIDVAFLSQFPVTSIRTYRHLRNKKNSWWLFSRDCLEVDFDVNGKQLTLYGNHLKSMMDGRDDTHDRRLEQAQAVANIVTDRWEDSGYDGNFIVLGDMNDYEDPDTALKPLLQHPGLVNTTKDMEFDASWTHYWAGGGEYRQLDFILVSKNIADSHELKPEIMRKGLPWRAEKYDGERFEEVGDNHPKASDHAPISIEISL